MKARKILLFTGIALLLLLLGYVFRTFIQVNIIEPAAFVLWALWRVLESINQNVYWQILIWGSVFLLIRFLPSKKISQTAYQHKNNSKEIGGSLYWHHLLVEAQFSINKRESLRHELETMLISTLVMQEQSSKETVQNKFVQKQYAFPDYIYQYFSENNNTWKTTLLNQWLKVVSFSPNTVQQLVTKSFLTNTRQIINWMQTQMESGNENPTFE